MPRTRHVEGSERKTYQDRRECRVSMFLPPLQSDIFIVPVVLSEFLVGISVDGCHGVRQLNLMHCLIEVRPRVRCNRDGQARRRRRRRRGSRERNEIE